MLILWHRQQFSREMLVQLMTKLFNEKTFFERILLSFGINISRRIIKVCPRTVTFIFDYCCALTVFPFLVEREKSLVHQLEWYFDCPSIRHQARRFRFKLLTTVSYINFLEYLFPEKRSASAVAKTCRPILTAISTYTHGRGIQYPTVVFTPRCQGGIKNPENYQCQPSRIVIECFHLQNELGDDDFLGLYSHEACQERCICGRKSCKSKQIHSLVCPLG